MGIVVAGSSVGGICWPFMLERLFGQIGFASTVRAAGFICLALLIPPCLLVKPRLPPRKGVKVSFRTVKEIFTDRTYIILTAAMFFVFWGMFIPFYYLPSYGLAHGMSLAMANNLLAILNAGSFVGRLVSGLMADRFGRSAYPALPRGLELIAGRFNITFICALCAGIVLMCLHAIQSAAGIIIFSILYGFFSGGLISLQTACVAQITPDMHMIGVKIGLMMAICSFGYVLDVVLMRRLVWLILFSCRVLTGSPIGGALINASNGGYGALINFSGIILLFGAFLTLCARLTINRGILYIV